MPGYALGKGWRRVGVIVYGEDMVTTGASNDIMQVASIAKRMVKEFGMSNLVRTNLAVKYALFTKRSTSKSTNPIKREPHGLR